MKQPSSSTVVPFKPAWWLKNRHLQTLWAPLLRRQPQPPTRTERVELADGDFVDLFWCGGESAEAIILILHGLTGSHQSHYVKGLQQRLANLGQASVAMHFRGAGEEPNRVARMYHSGDTADLDVCIDMLRARGFKRIAVAGFSLGGNVLLKWLGEKGADAPVVAAVAVSVPFSLGVVADTMNLGVARLYRNHMLGELRASLLRKREWARVHSPQILKQLQGLGALERLQTFRIYDNEVVAPLNGFRDADDYYQQCSSQHVLRNIAVRTLIIHSSDDPLMTADIVPCHDGVSSSVELEIYPHGGHVGFVAGSVPLRPVYWLDTRVSDYLLAGLQDAQ